jgi:hypothetical protein
MRIGCRPVSDVGVAWCHEPVAKCDVGVLGHPILLP